MATVVSPHPGFFPYYLMVWYFHNQGVHAYRHATSEGVWKLPEEGRHTERGESVASRVGEVVGGARFVFRRAAPVGLTESETHALLTAAKRHHGSLH